MGGIVHSKPNSETEIETEIETETETPKFFREGTYGCVHKPSLKCKDKTIISKYNDKISKIMTKKNALEEMQSYKIGRAHV